MLEKLNFTSVDGRRSDRAITVYALSTCGFCKRAMAFLNDRGFSYRYLYVDHVPLDVKSEIKRELKERFRADVAFPFAVIDNDKHLVGFIEADWAATLGL
jgi:glutaredoxin-like protein NrdH